MFVIGNETRPRRNSMTQRPTSAADNFPRLSHSVTVGRNSHFRHLSKRDREELGGIEYRSLKLLLKIVLGTFEQTVQGLMLTICRLRRRTACRGHCRIGRLDI